MLWTRRRKRSARKRSPKRKPQKVLGTLGDCIMVGDILAVTQLATVAALGAATVAEVEPNLLLVRLPQYIESYNTPPLALT